MKMRRSPEPEESLETEKEGAPATPDAGTRPSSLASVAKFGAATQEPLAQSRSEHEGHVLIGEGVHIKGEIRECQKLEIRGIVDGDVETDVLVVQKSGRVEGRVNANRAEVHGSIDGEISVKSRLDVKAKGSVAGQTKYGELSVEAGGRVVGALNEQTGTSAKPEAARETSERTPATPKPAVARHQAIPGLEEENQPAGNSNGRSMTEMAP